MGVRASGDTITECIRSYTDLGFFGYRLELSKVIRSLCRTWMNDTRRKLAPTWAQGAGGGFGQARFEFLRYQFKMFATFSFPEPNLGLGLGGRCSRRLEMVASGGGATLPISTCFESILISAYASEINTEPNTDTDDSTALNWCGTAALHLT